MQTRRAVAACLPAADLGRLGDALAGAGFVLAAIGRDAGEALRLVNDHRPDLLLADAILPGGDGAWLARRVNAMTLELYPAILLMLPAGLGAPPSLAPEALEALGAAAIEKPVTSEAVTRALERLNGRAALLPPEREARLQALLDRLGVPDHPGRAMLARAVALCWRDRRRLSNLRDRVYPLAGARLGKSGAQAERAMRYAIDAAWRTGEIEQQHQIFGDTIDARRGRPTCGEMIAQLADILRWEV